VQTLSGSFAKWREVKIDVPCEPGVPKERSQGHASLQDESTLTRAEELAQESRLDTLEQIRCHLIIVNVLRWFIIIELM
jgi:hypothetical protein